MFSSMAETDKNIRHIKMNVLSLAVFFISCFFQNEEVNAQQQYIISSSFLYKADTVWVFAPEDREINSCLYLLHGYGGNYMQWNKISGLQAVADSTGILIICPDGFNDSWYFDGKLEDDHLNYTSFFIHKLIPFIDSLYNTNQQPRYIGGLSMGGYGAFYIYLKSPLLFTAAFSSSGAFDFSKPVMQSFGIEKRLGNYSDNKSMWKEMSMINQMQQIMPWHHYRFYMDCGYDDPFLEANKMVNKHLKDIPCENVLMLLPGAHSRKYWQKSILIYINIIKSDVI